MGRLKKFFSKIREADETTKKKWLWILTPVFMGAVIVLWLIYINSSVLALKEENLKKVKTEAVKQPSYFEVFKKGFAAIINKIKEAAEKNRSIVIKGNKFNFIMEETEKINREKLPN